MEFFDSSCDSILIRFGELGLKDSNRGFFERKLQENIQNGLHGLKTGSTERLQGGLKVHLEASSPLTDILDRLERIPGIAWFAPCWETDRTPEAVSETVLNRMPDFPDTVNTFAVETQRSDKSLPLTSQDFNVEIGAALDRETNLSVDLDDPDWSVHVHLLFDRAYVFFHRREGFRGLPVGCSGSAISLLSGGIDSPVSSIQAFKRGLRLDFLHYYPYPTSEEALDQKMRPLIEEIVEYGTHGKIYMLPFHEYDLQGPAASASDRDEIILFRRHMVRLANRIANRNDLKALVTGDSLGQVASQTLENIDTVTAASERPILRPLIGLDKQEIIDRAQKYGTFEISTGPYQDCCSIRTKRVRTKSSRDRFRKLESDQDTDRLDRAMLESADVYKYSRGTLEKMADHDVVKSDPTNAESHGTPGTLQ